MNTNKKYAPPTKEYKEFIARHLNELIQVLQHGDDDGDGKKLAESYSWEMGRILKMYFNDEWAPQYILGWNGHWIGSVQNVHENFVKGHMGGYTAKDGDRFEMFDRMVHYDGSTPPLIETLGGYWTQVQQRLWMLRLKKNEFWDTICDWLQIVVAVAQFILTNNFKWFQHKSEPRPVVDGFDYEKPMNLVGKRFFDRKTILWEVMKDDEKFINRLETFQDEWSTICKRVYVKSQRQCMYKLVDFLKNKRQEFPTSERNTFMFNLCEFKFKRQDVQRFVNHDARSEFEDVDPFTGNTVSRRSIEYFPDQFQYRINSTAPWQKVVYFWKQNETELQYLNGRDLDVTLLYLRAMCAFLSLVTMKKKFNETTFEEKLENFHGGSMLRHYGENGQGYQGPAYTILNQDMSFNPYLIVQ